MPEDEHKKDDTQAKIEENAEREEAEPQAQTVNWAWAFNFKKLLEDREKLFNEGAQQDTTRRNMTNSLVDKLDTAYATHFAESLSIEREDRSARLAAERADIEAKRLLFNNSHYYQMNWLYEFTDLALIDYLKKIGVDPETLSKIKAVVKSTT